uniref:capsule assembly Wzi family protein n=1 Tax=uncultured Draconibacterium sp. TaxID=1573823 RepID=UPI0032172C44
MQTLQLKLYILLLILLAAFTTNAQVITAEFNSLAGSKGRLPFWLWANQLGKYDPGSNSIQNLNLSAFLQQPVGDSDFSYETGINLDFLLADDNDIRFTKLFGGINWKFLQVKAGTFAEEEVFAGLSTTNGNLAKSRNARPYPRIRIGFNRYVPVLTPWFSVYGHYEEGLLNDHRYVENTHLHSKALYFRLGTPSSVQLSAGLEHSVMWAGTHPVYGKLQGKEVYWDYVMAKSGNEEALTTDQINVMGNGFGTYQIQVHKDLQKLAATLYISHPYDDFSGSEWENRIDNLYGLFIALKKEAPLVKNIILEYYHTKHQSGSYHQKVFPDGSIHGSGCDNYFNHGVYRSGVTYHQMAMVSPLFAPVIISDGISMGFESTRFSGYHLAANGYLNPNLGWKAMGTYSHHLGKYDSNENNTYNPARKQASSLLQLSWKLKHMPLSLNIECAADYGALYDEGTTTMRMGTKFSILWKIK